MASGQNHGEIFVCVLSVIVLGYMYSVGVKLNAECLGLKLENAGKSIRVKRYKISPSCLHNDISLLS